MIRHVLALVVVAGCVAPVDDGGAWTPAAAMTGELAPEVGPALPAVRPATCTPRIASWNVHFGEDTAGLAEIIRTSAELARADVILIQEIEAYGSEGATRTARLAEALGMTWVYAPARVEGEGTHGIALLSRHPLSGAAVMELPYFDQVLNPRNRIALAADLVLGEQRLRLVNVHLDVRLGAVDRVRQLAPAVRDLDERVVIGGDFNTNPWAWGAIVPLASTQAIVGQSQAAVLDDYLLEGHRLETAIAPDTSTIAFPGYTIRTDDLYARGLPILASGVDRVGGSDHWAVWFDVDVCR